MYCTVQHTVYSTIVYIKYLLVTIGEVLNSVLYNAVVYTVQYLL